MPLVVVRWNPVALGLMEDTFWVGGYNKKICGFTNSLPGIVARHLHVEEMKEARLSPADVEAHANRTQLGDVSKYAVDITILANTYEPRLANLDVRREGIVDDVQLALIHWFPKAGPLKASVWVLLCPGSFGELEIN